MLQWLILRLTEFGEPQLQILLGQEQDKAKLPLSITELLEGAYTSTPSNSAMICSVVKCL